MGRRSLIPISAINKLISSSRRREREKYNESLIEANKGLKKELSPVYELIKVDFDDSSRNTKIEIQQTQQYRTIERYVTKNYVRYPVYSNWKTRSRVIKKSIKLTNASLEALNKNDDYIIQQLSDEIIIALNNEDLHPSWFIEKQINKEHEEKIQLIEQESLTFKKNKEDNIRHWEIKSKVLSNTLPRHEKILKKLQKKLYALQNKLNRANAKHQNLFLNIITLGVRSLLLSNKRKQKLKLKIKKQTDLVDDKINFINNIKKEIEKYQNNVNENYQLLELNSIEISKRMKEEKYSYMEKLKEITPLSTTYIPDNSFISLKKFMGLQYDKIIGCYVIHNKEQNQKYYVGQSKDIMKRINQHFKGLVPNNIIFAEDYYSTATDVRDNMFELKIIPCETKDELDKTEKELIEQYDAYNKGYNRTSGNS